MTTKIVLTGSHGVGKTTLATNLYATLRQRHDVSLIPETARLLVEMGYEVNDNINENGVITYLELYLRNSRGASGDFVISDRSIFDLFVYTHKLAGAAIKEKYIDLVKELVFAEVANVFRYIYIPVEFDMTLDGVRPQDRDYQREIDAEVRALLKYFGARTIVASGPIDKRLSVIMESINALPET